MPPETESIAAGELSAAQESSAVQRVVLLSRRGPSLGLEQNRDRARRIALALIDDDPGREVVWICPVSPGEHVPQAEGLPEAVEVRPVVSVAPVWFRVWHRVSDAPTEYVLAQALRDKPADAVHVLSYGHCDSATAPWVSARLGFPAVVDVQLARAVCHRGDLVHAQGSNCEDWLDPERCFQCCRSACGRGPSNSDARRWRMLSFLGGWSPYPMALEFHNRRDLVLGALQGALRIRVEDEMTRGALANSGISPKSLVVQGHDVVGDSLVELYAQARA